MEPDKERRFLNMLQEPKCIAKLWQHREDCLDAIQRQRRGENPIRKQESPAFSPFHQLLLCSDSGIISLKQECKGS